MTNREKSPPMGARREFAKSTMNCQLGWLCVWLCGGPVGQDLS